MRCAACGAEVPAGARFCPSCGQPTAPVAGPAEERRIVTVLFADLVGFTTLAEHLDPEQVKRMIDACFERLVGVVNEFGGRVDKLMGDGMLALFGAPVTHEDDPERAVRAALRMQEVIAEQGDELRMRIGINTGEVLVGTLAGTDYTAMGDVVNTAARLQSSAPAGGVLVGESTHGLTSHTFRFEAAGTVQAKGREQTIEAWLALAPTAPPGARRRRRRDVPFVGRADEMGVVTAGLRLSATHGRALMVHAGGETGVGKSRLLDEVVQHLRDAGDVSVLEGSCVPYGESNVWWPIANALADHLDQVDVSMPPDELRSVARERSATMFPVASAAHHDRVADVFVHLMGHPSPLDRLDAASTRTIVHRTVGEVLEAQLRKHPVVLRIDDLHWADTELLDLLGHLVTALGRHRFVLLTSMRPGSEVDWPAVGDRTDLVNLALQPLSRHETDELATALLDGTAPDAVTLTTLFDRSGGNPLFLIELVALTGARGDHHELPDSLRTLIAARLDQLDGEQRRVIENAAVIGPAGDVSSLERFAEALGQTIRPGMLDELDELDLLEIRGRRWEFRSEAVRDAAYQTLSKAARAQRHAGVARSMLARQAGIDDVAHHAATAAELVQELGPVNGVPDTIATDAVQVLVTAADRAVTSGNHRNAMRHATRAIDLLPCPGVDDRTEAHLRLVRAGAAVELRLFAEAAADIDHVAKAGEQLGDTTLVAETHRLRGMAANSAGHTDEARAELGRAVDLLRGTDRPDLLAGALRMRGFIEMFTGSLEDAEWFFGEADGLYRSLGDDRGMAYVQQNRAFVSFMSGNLARARQQLHDAADTLMSVGDNNGVGWAIGLLAFVEFFEGNFEEAEELASTVRREAEQRGDEWATAMMDTLTADLRLWQGRLDEAHQLAERSRVRFKRLGDRFGMVQALAPLVRSQIALGKGAAAQRTVEELASLANTSGQGVFPLAAAAGAAMHRGNGTTAAALAERALDELGHSGGATFEPTIILVVASLQSGDVERAEMVLDRVPAFAREQPFTLSAAALVHALARRSAEAVQEASKVTRAPGATYLDQVIAHVAAAGAQAQSGSHALARLEAEAAVARATEVGDVMAIALATAAFHRVTGHRHTAADEGTVLGDGWATVVDLLT